MIKGEIMLKKGIFFLVSIMIISCQIWCTTYAHIPEKELFTSAPIVVVAQCRGSIPGAARFLVVESLRGKHRKNDEISVNAFSATPGYYYLMTLWPSDETPLQRMTSYSAAAGSGGFDLTLCQYRKPRTQGMYGLKIEKGKYNFNSKYQRLKLSFDEVKKWTSQKIVVDQKKEINRELPPDKIEEMIKRNFKKGERILSQDSINKMQLGFWLMSFTFNEGMPEKIVKKLREELSEFHVRYRKKLDLEINNKFNFALASLGDRTACKKAIDQLSKELPQMFKKSETKSQIKKHNELVMNLTSLFNRFPDKVINMITKVEKPEWYNQRFWNSFARLLAEKAESNQRGLLKCRFTPIFLAAALRQAEKGIRSAKSLKRYSKRIKILAQSKILEEKIKAIRLLLALGYRDAGNMALDVLEEYGKGKSQERYNRGRGGRKGFNTSPRYTELKNIQVARWAYLFFASLTMFHSERPVIADSYDYSKYSWGSEEFRKWWDKYGATISVEKLYYAAFPVTRIDRK